MSVPPRSGLDHSPPWLDDPDLSPPTKRTCMVDLRSDSLPSCHTPSPADAVDTPEQYWPSPSQPMCPDASRVQIVPAGVCPPFETPVTEAINLDFGLSSLSGPLYLIPAIVSGKPGFDDVVVYMVSTSPTRPTFGVPMPAPRALAPPRTRQKAFPNRKALKPQFHTGTRQPYVCQACGKGFRTAIGLGTHRRNRHCRPSKELSHHRLTQCVPAPTEEVVTTTIEPSLPAAAPHDVFNILSQFLDDNDLNGYI